MTQTDQTELTITLTQDQSLVDLPQYQVILDSISKLANTGVLQNLSGNCVAACDLMAALLVQAGIDCAIVECQATVQRKNNNGQSDFALIGFDNLFYTGQVDTHTVVITKTATPILIDVSISEYLDADHPFVVEKVNGADPQTLGNYRLGDVSVLYQSKKNIRLPSIHQRGIMERIKQEENNQRIVKKLTIGMVAVLCIAVVNFLANVSLLFLKVF